MAVLCARVTVTDCRAEALAVSCSSNEAFSTHSQAHHLKCFKFAKQLLHAWYMQWATAAATVSGQGPHFYTSTRASFPVCLPTRQRVREGLLAGGQGVNLRFVEADALLLLNLTRRQFVAGTLAYVHDTARKGKQLRDCCANAVHEGRQGVVVVATEPNVFPCV